MKSKYKPFTLLSIENLTWEEFYETYQYIIYNISATRNIEKKQNMDILKSKYEFLIDLILSITPITKNFKLNAKLLERVLGTEGKDYIFTLLKLGIIKQYKPYILGKSSTTYRLKDDVSIITNINYFNYKVEGYKKKNEELVLKYWNKKEGETKDKLGDYLFYKYKESLLKLKLIKESELIQYIKNKKFNNIESEEYYHKILYQYQNINNFNNKILADDNYRIYSILTRTPKNYKTYLNIKFSIDCNNSHPLIFSYFLIKKYKINTSKIESFYCVHDNFCNLLDMSCFQGVPLDVLKYINLTFIGDFWNQFMEIDPTLDKSELKQRMFEEVFYAKKKSNKWARYAVFFKKHYPTVFNHISVARERNLITNAKRTKKEKKDHLANNMMTLESKIFRNILTKLYAKNIICLNIHDAIVVLDVKQNKNVTSEAVELVMKQTFREYDLIPTFDVS